MSRSREVAWSDAAMAIAVLALGIGLCGAGFGLITQWQAADGHSREISLEILLAAVATAAGVGLVLWWIFAAACAGLSVLLARKGRRQAAASVRRFSPAFMQRAVVAALSVQLLAGPAAHADGRDAGPAWTPTPSHSTSAPATSSAQDGLTASTSAVAVPSGPATEPPPARETAPTPGQPEPAQPVSTLAPGWRPAPHVVEPGLLAAPEARGASGAVPGTRPETVTVLAGDTLWGIVASHLGPGASDVDVALEWPRWYTANRQLIGGNPDVLLPGQVLQVPEAS